MKGYFAPDAIAGLVAVVFVVAIGLFFMHFFASGLLMHAIIKLMDTEKPMACQIFLQSIIGDEYCRYALPEHKEFSTAYKYYGSYYEEGNLDRIKSKIENALKTINQSKYVNITCYDIYVGPEDKSLKCKGKGVVSCTIPIYSPAGGECHASISYKATFGETK